MKEKKHFETQAVRTQVSTTQHKEHSVPLYLTSGFVFDDAEEMRASFAEEKQRDLYSRYSNPNTSELIAKICQMELAQDGFAFASGMAAVYTTFATFLSSGDHIIACHSLFGATYSLLTKYFPKWHIKTSFFSSQQADRIESLIQPNTKILYVETPTNPAVDILDLEYLNGIAKKHGVLFIVDNCFATPYLQQPIAWGADLVIHSATKMIDGQGRVLGGIVVGNKDLIREIYLFARLTGPALAPFNAWVLSKSLETLAVRAEKQCSNAMQLATYLEKHPKVLRVRYPFLESHPQYAIAKKQMSLGGVVVAFEVKGGKSAGQQFFDNVQMCSLCANLGDTRTIITHPASTTHAKVDEAVKKSAGITDGLVRCSLGLEHIDDIIADVAQALEKI